ncbi:glucooligosaccharide oxidase [Mucidula mucida]|nr:glucooligosaccharide oxidase [Mucidula mucida]
MAMLFVIVFACISVALAQNASQLQEDFARAGVTAIFPADALYANATQPYNLRFAYQPIGIAYPTTTEQVAASLLAGTRQGLKIVARSGGHSYIANGLGGKNGSLVIDLSSLTSIVVNTDNTALLGVGNRLGDIALGLNEYGRAMPHGRCSYVGLGGHAAFGGYGFTSRMWGLTLDVVVAVEVVLANGTTTTASATQYPDLFWALRGSASSFGITTFIRVATYPAPDSALYATYTWEMDIANATHTLSEFQRFVDSGIPAELGYFGSLETFSDTVKPFLSLLMEPANTSFFSGNYIEGLSSLSLASLNTSAPDNTDTFYAKSLMTPDAEPMTWEAMEAFVTYLATDGFATNLAGWFVETELYGGSNSALNKVPLDQTAFAHRSSRFNMQIYGSNIVPPFPDDGFTFINGVASSIIDNMPEKWDYGQCDVISAYINYVEDRLNNWQDLYYGHHYQPLQELKTLYDPLDVFDFPSSIEK